MKLSRLLIPTIVSCALSIQLLFGAPVITGVSPNCGSAAGGDTVTITGSGFTGTTHVYFGPSAAASFTYISDTQMNAQSPQAVPGTVHITVQVGPDTSLISQADRFTYQGSWFAYISGFNSQFSPEAWYVDLADNTLAGNVSLLQQAEPWGIAITPDGRAAYVGDYGAAEETPTRVNAIDLVSNTPTAIVCTGHLYSDFLAISPHGETVFPTFREENSIGTIDVATNTLTSTISPTQGTPQGIAISPDGAKIYVADSRQPTITVFEEGGSHHTIDLPGSPWCLAITPDGGELYVTTLDANVYVMNTISEEITTISTSAISTNGIAITPDGRYVYVVDDGSEGDTSQVLQIRTSETTVVNTITYDGSHFRGIFISPDGKRAFVTGTNETELDVFVIDLTTFAPEIIQTISIDAPGEANFITITPDPSPAAEFSVAVGSAGASTTFDASRSVTGVGTIVKYVWNFGDGTTEETTMTPNISHVYASAGIYDVTLTVTNSAGTSIVQTFTGQTVSNNGSLDNARFVQPIVIPSPQSPSFFFGKLKKHDHHLYLKAHWTPSPSENVVWYQVYKNDKLLYTTSTLKFKKHMYPDHAYRHHHSDYKHYLERQYKVRAVTSTGATSDFTWLFMK